MHENPERPFSRWDSRTESDEVEVGVLRLKLDRWVRDTAIWAGEKTKSPARNAGSFPSYTIREPSAKCRANAAEGHVCNLGAMQGESYANVRKMAARCLVQAA